MDRPVLRIAGTLAAAALAALPPVAHARVPGLVGKAAPAFRLLALDGTPVLLDRFRGRPLFINVFASWCPPCRAELPAIVAAYPRYRGRVAFLGVDAQEPPTLARRFAGEMRLDFPVAIDGGQMEASYGARGIPESVFIDRDGVVRSVVHGALQHAALERSLAAIAGERKR